EGLHLEQCSDIGAKHFEVHKPWLRIQPQHHKATRECHDDGCENKERSRDPFELKVKDQEYHQQTQRNNQRQPLLCPNLIFIGSRKFEADSRRNLEFTGIDLALKVSL